MSPAIWSRWGDGDDFAAKVAPNGFQNCSRFDRIGDEIAVGELSDGENVDVLLD
jgi:hypothetical protein